MSTHACRYNLNRNFTSIAGVQLPLIRLFLVVSLLVLPLQCDGARLRLRTLFMLPTDTTAKPVSSFATTIYGLKSCFGFDSVSFSVPLSPQPCHRRRFYHPRGRRKTVTTQILKDIPRGGELVMTSSSSSVRENSFDPISSSSSPTMINTEQQSAEMISSSSSSSLTSLLYILPISNIALPTLPPNLATILSLIFSTTTGYLCDNNNYRYLKFLRGVGTLVTFIISSILAYVRFSSSTHFLYDLSWSTFLPMSLALILLSSSSSSYDTGKTAIIGGHDDEISAITSISLQQTPSIKQRTRTKIPKSKSPQPLSTIQSITRQEVEAVSIPFIIGSIGSILGCTISFFLSIYTGKRKRQHSKLWFWSHGHLLLQPNEAAVAAGCLCASYIGGPVNFFATARIVADTTDMKRKKLYVGGDLGRDQVLESIFGSSAADLLVMSLYLATITAGVSSSVLQRWFPGRVGNEYDNYVELDACDVNIEKEMVEGKIIPSPSDRNTVMDLDYTKTDKKESSAAINYIANVITNTTDEFQLIPVSKWPIWSNLIQTGKAACAVASLAWMIVEISNRVERMIENKFNIPGMGCACVALLGTWGNALLHKTNVLCIPLPWKKNNGNIRQPTTRLSSISDTKSNDAIANTNAKFRAKVDKSAQALSDICFHLLFASIGSSANLGRTIHDGIWHSSAGFLFAALALIVHIVVILLGSLSLSQLLSTSSSSSLSKEKKLKSHLPFFPLNIDEIMVASNAAVGGPATAAAFAANIGEKVKDGKRSGEDMKRNDNDNSWMLRRRGLIMAATVWGTVGYAVATSIGVALTKMLLVFLPSSDVQ